MGFSTLYPSAMAANVATLYPKVPMSSAGTRLLCHPFAAAMPAAVDGPAAPVQTVTEMEAQQGPLKHCTLRTSPFRGSCLQLHERGILDVSDDFRGATVGYVVLGFCMGSRASEGQAAGAGRARTPDVCVGGQQHLAPAEPRQAAKP